MDDIKLAMLGNKDAAKRLTDAGVLVPCPFCGKAVNLRRVSSSYTTSPTVIPVWRVKQSVVHTDYADGTADTEVIKKASWCCPVCDWFVGEQVEIFGRKHNQQKKNFCDRCGQMIDWEGVNSGE